MRASAASLTAFKVAIGRGGASFAWFETIRIHGKTHTASWLAPFESGIFENAVQSLFFSLSLHQTASRHNEGLNVAFVDGHAKWYAKDKSPGWYNVYDEIWGIW